MSLWNTSSSSVAARKAASRFVALQNRSRCFVRLTRRRDIRPVQGEQWIPAHGQTLPNLTQSAPRVLWVEATDTVGKLASWWNSGWWERCLTAWKSQRLRLVVLPTPGAILLPAVVERLRQIAAVTSPRWRLVARTDGAEVAHTAAIDLLLKTPYHELEWTVSDEACSTHGRGHAGLLAERSLAAMKHLIELRQARGLRRPKVTWLWPGGADACDAERLAAVRAVARQVQVDRLVIPPAFKFAERIWD